MDAPNFEEFTFYEKMLIDRLYKVHGKNWKEISKKVPGRTPIIIKTYWLKKQHNERVLRSLLSSYQKFNLAKADDIRNIQSGYQSSSLDRLALVASLELKSMK